MKRICSIYKSPRKNEMYLYVLKADALKRVPEGLLAVFGPPAHAFDLVLNLCAGTPREGQSGTWIVPEMQAAYRAWHRELLGKLVVSGACVVALGSVALVNYQGLSSLFRNHHEIRLMLVPSNYIGASAGYLREQVVSARQPFIKIGEDAERNPDVKLQPRKSLTVLVVALVLEWRRRRPVAR